jgi:hypothetical protein
MNKQQDMKAANLSAKIEKRKNPELHETKVRGRFWGYSDHAHLAFLSNPKDIRKRLQVLRVCI